jgi:hypothetical protein
MKKGPHVYLLHIVEAIESIDKSLQGVTEKQFKETQLFIDFQTQKPTSFSRLSSGGGYV